MKQTNMVITASSINSEHHQIPQNSSPYFVPASPTDPYMEKRFASSSVRFSDNQLYGASAPMHVNGEAMHANGARTALSKGVNGSVGVISKGVGKHVSNDTAAVDGADNVPTARLRVPLNRQSNRMSCLRHTMYWDPTTIHK